MNQTRAFRDGESSCMHTRNSDPRGTCVHQLKAKQLQLLFLGLRFRPKGLGLTLMENPLPTGAVFVLDKLLRMF